MLRFIAVVLLLVLVGAGAAHAADEKPPQAAAPTWLSNAMGTGASAEIVSQFSPTLSKIDEMIARTDAVFNDRNWREQDLDSATQKLTDARATLRKFSEQLEPRLAEAKARLAKLGPPPKEGEQEAAGLKEQRKTIGDEVGAYDALIKRADVLSVQAGQVVTGFNTKRRLRFVRELLRRSDGFTSRAFWNQALSSVPTKIDRLIDTVSLAVKSRINAPWYWLALGVVIVLSVAVGVNRLFRRLLRNNTVPAANYVAPPRMERGAMVLRRAMALSLPVFAALALVFLTATSFELIIGDERAFFGRCFIYIGVATFLISALHFALLPGIAAQRLIAIETSSARQICWVLTVFVLVWLLDQISALLDTALFSPLPLIIVRSLFIAMIFGFLLTCLLVIFVERKDAPAVTRQTNGWPRPLFALIAVLALTIFGAAATGYVSLARFIGSQLVATGGLILIVTLVHLAAEFLSTPAKPATDAKTEDGAASHHTVINTTLGVLIGLALDLLLLVIGIPLLLLQWGYEWAEVQAWMTSAVFGVQIGGLRLSLMTVFASLGILLAGVILTRLVRNMFVRRSEHLFADGSGARDSIATVLSYAGFVLSVIAALSYLGVEVANLALIAGALSVGIGFGLQSIANNFVSGLILLAERPIKAGDWIIVGNREGRVQKISVRSTQIRTFDRSTVIVPNADLITGQVVNWDHGDTVGRITIAVGASYSADPRQVIEILTKIGNSHPMVMRTDASPRVVFEGFGESSLDFSLRVMLRDIKNTLTVQTDLRVWIVEAFRENSIEIPFPQRDLHLVELPSAAASKVEIAPDEGPATADGTSGDAIKQPDTRVRA